jgi:hypothetical protein
MGLDSNNDVEAMSLIQTFRLSEVMLKIGWKGSIIKLIWLCVLVEQQKHPRNDTGGVTIGILKTTTTRTWVSYLTKN